MVDGGWWGVVSTCSIGAGGAGLAVVEGIGPAGARHALGVG